MAGGGARRGARGAPHGRAVLHEDGYIGVGVSRAARICAAGHGGQILLSHATAGVVEDLDLPGVTLRELGRYRLKDRPPLTAAVHTGRVADPDAGHLGTPALRALRLCAAAAPWQVLVSHATHAMLEGQAIHPVELRDLGERDLPGGDGPTRVFEAVTATAG